MAEIRGTISKERADRIVAALAACHRELRAEPGLDAWDMGELGGRIDAAKDAICRRIRDDEEAQQ